MKKELLIPMLFAVFMTAAIVPRIIQKLKGVETVGCINIDKRLFVLGKVSLFASFAAIPLHTFAVNLSLFDRSALLYWLCIALLAIGVSLFTSAIAGLGTFSLRVGSARSETALRTTGIYRFTRNPMLLGLYCMALGSAVYVQNPINWAFVLTALLIHHKIILAEEVALRERFGDAWVAYQSRVRRYV